MCYCVGFARQFHADENAENNDCPTSSKKFCRKNWLTQLDAWRNTQNEYTRKIVDEYEKDCLSRYDNEMFDRETRDLYVKADASVPNTPYCSKWSDETKANFEAIESDLTSLLSKYYRVKNAKNLKVKAENGSIADKLIMYKQLQILFEVKPVDYNHPTGDPDRKDGATGSGFEDCVFNSDDIKRGDRVTFDIMTASSLNKGKTLLLKMGTKYLLMTFGAATRDTSQSGTFKFCDSGGVSKMSISQMGR